METSEKCSASEKTPTQLAKNRTVKRSLAVRSDAPTTLLQLMMNDENGLAANLPPGFTLPDLKNVNGVSTSSASLTTPTSSAIGTSTRFNSTTGMSPQGSLTASTTLAPSTSKATSELVKSKGANFKVEPASLFKAQPKGTSGKKKKKKKRFCCCTRL